MSGRLVKALFCAVSILNATVASAGTKLAVVPLAAQEQLVLTPATLGVIVNLNDPQSVELGHTYARIRGVPEANIIGLRLPKVNFVARHLMVRELQVLRLSPAYSRIAAFALAFDKPYRVDTNQSVTSAVAQGIASDINFKGPCNDTRENPDAATLPGAPMVAKPAMLLSVTGSPEGDRALFERGKAADVSDPQGTVYLVKTGDRARSGPREQSMDRAQKQLGGMIAVDVSRQPQGLAGANGIIGYQTGLAAVPNLETLGFLPGAYADHLTSYGGALLDNRNQTTAAAFIKAGATASYGTVREPCNIPAKFPDPERLLGNYLAGDSLIEAYWKSVSMTTEGLFVGEPLARPFPLFDAELDGETVTVKVNRRSEVLLAQESEQGAPKTISFFAVQTGRPQFITRLPLADHAKAGDLIADFKVKAPSGGPLMLGIGLN